ncbi:MAG: ASPIC/UnbV domain-containing protein [Saprospiraceae bacterium]|nr:ASPIC/UnbV domain-containing protein [Saprospiraceae bacterium]
MSNTHCIIFGLGSNATIDEIEVAWPDGKKDRITGLQPNKMVYVREGKIDVLNIVLMSLFANVQMTKASVHQHINKFAH